ncbi:MAG TPA: energy-coupling factor transporter transmembrane component T [Candidatus Nanopelagicales bacterium]|nr:energy-coupling factor transporter transmembrane component T [Candidatus Nanopelagicales bacterium]
MTTFGDAALPRWLHPGAWWLWALGLAAAASRTTNPLLLILIIAVTGWVVSRRRSTAPWARSYAVFLRFALAIIAFRVLFTVVFGVAVGSHVLVTLPEVGLPDWAAGVRLGGPVTAEQLLQASYLGLQLAAIIVCIGAANSLASPSRLLKSVPAALYEVGVAVIVAMTFAPQLVADVGRVRTAQRLRGRPVNGIRGLTRSVVPVLEGALERAVALAAAMDSRGYGRTAGLPRRVRVGSAALLLGGLLGSCLGVYGLLDSGTAGAFALPVLAAGVCAAVVGLALAGRRGVRTRYRPDPWRLPEWLVAISGAVPAAVVIAVSYLDPLPLVGQYSPVVWPTLPLLPAAAVAVALLAGIVAPPPPGALVAPRPVRRNPLAVNA